jgi:lariat debranching enzyme
MAFGADGVSFLVPQLRKPLDVILSHDWPDVTSYGDVEKLCAGHPHWKYAASSCICLIGRNARAFSNRVLNVIRREEIEKGELGCHLYTKLLKSLKPSYWLSGHMHCRFDATVPHTGDQSTHFIALDKVLPRRPFLDVRTPSQHVIVPTSPYQVRTDKPDLDSVLHRWYLSPRPLVLAC